VKIAIAKLYEENRELIKKLVERTFKTSMSHSREGNANWLKKQLREAQYVIIQLHEEQRMSEERISENLEKCGPSMENVHATLVSAQTKLKGNTVLQR
jgi:hypothetical protein